MIKKLKLIFEERCLWIVLCTPFGTSCHILYNVMMNILDWKPQAGSLKNHNPFILSSRYSRYDPSPPLFNYDRNIQACKTKPKPLVS